MEEEYATTGQNFLVFIDEAKRLIRQWGLVQWKVYFEHISLAKDGCRANVTCDLNSYVCVIRLSTIWNSEATITSIKSAAMHEVIHLILAKFACLGRLRYLSSEEMQSEEEALIHTFMNIITGKEATFEIIENSKVKE